MQPKDSYLIAACPRTGSWLLTYALQDFGTVGVPDEYFAQDIEAFWAGKWGITSPEDGGSYRDYLQAAFRTGTSDNGVFGSKLLWEWVANFTARARTMPEFAEIDDSGQVLVRAFPGLRLVMLRRRNKVRAAVSFWRAGVSGVWAVLPSGEPAWRSPRLPLRDEFSVVTIDELHARAHAEEDAWLRLAESMQVPRHDVVYEDLIQAWDATLIGVVEFLGQKPAPGFGVSPPRLQRQADGVTDHFVELWSSMTGGCAECGAGPDPMVR